MIGLLVSPILFNFKWGRLNISSNSRHEVTVVSQEKMSFANFVSFTENMLLLKVVQELRDRGPNTMAPNQELRAELAQVLFKAIFRSFLEDLTKAVKWSPDHKYSEELGASPSFWSRFNARTPASKDK